MRSRQAHDRAGPGQHLGSRPTARSAPSATRLPSSFSSTVPLTSMVAPVSSSGTTTGAENRTPNSTSAPASPGPVGDVPAGLRHGEHAVGDDVGQADRLGDPLVPVDHVEVTGRAAVLDQAEPVDRVGHRGQFRCPPPRPRSSLRSCAPPLHQRPETGADRARRRPSGSRSRWSSSSCCPPPGSRRSWTARSPRRPACSGREYSNRCSPWTTIA